MFRFLDAIAEEKQKNIDELDTEDVRIDFYKNLLKDGTPTDIIQAAKLDDLNLMTAIIFDYYPNLSHDQMETILASILTFMNDKSISKIYLYLDKLKDIVVDQDKYLEASSYLNGFLFFPLIFLDKKSKAQSERLKEIDNLIKKMNMSKEETALFLKILHACLDGVTTAIHTKMALQIVLSSFNNYSEANKNMSYSNIKKLVKEDLKGKINFETLMDIINCAIKRGENAIITDQKNKKKLAKANIMYDRLKQDLIKALSGGEIRNAEELLSKIPSPKVRLEALRLIYQHNKKIYSKMAAEYNELSANNKSHYQVLLAKYGILSNDHNVEMAMTKSLVDASKIFEDLTSVGLTTPSILLKAVSTSDSETIARLTSLISKEIITNDLVINNESLFDKYSTEYASLMNNLDFLVEQKANPKAFNTGSILLTEPVLLQENYQVLLDYELISSLKTDLNHSFLAQEDLSHSIDTLLELGYEDYLEEDLNLLNYKDRFARLRLVKTLNIPIDTKDELLAVLTTDKFYVPDDEIYDYLYNAVDYQEQVIEESNETSRESTESLENYINTKRTYSFAGVIISKNKVKRNLEKSPSLTPESLLSSVVSGSTLTDQEYVKLKSCLNPSKKI